MSRMRARPGINCDISAIERLGENEADKYRYSGFLHYTISWPRLLLIYRSPTPATFVPRSNLRDELALSRALLINVFDIPDRRRRRLPPRSVSLSLSSPLSLLVLLPFASHVHQSYRLPIFDFNCSLSLLRYVTSH